MLFSSFLFISLSSFFWEQNFQHCIPFSHCDPCIPFSSWGMQGSSSLQGPRRSPRPASKMGGRTDTRQLSYSSQVWLRLFLFASLPPRLISHPTPPEAHFHPATLEALVCVQSLNQSMAVVHRFSPRFLFAHQTGCLAICLFQVRKDEIVTADGKMWKSDNDSNKEEHGSNRGNEEQALSEKKRPRDLKVTSERRREKIWGNEICKAGKRKVDYEFANCSRQDKSTGPGSSGKLREEIKSADGCLVCCALKQDNKMYVLLLCVNIHFKDIFAEG